MRNPKHTEENIRKLAEECVEFWDMDCLVDFAVSRLISDYKGDKELFPSGLEGYYAYWT